MLIKQSTTRKGPWDLQLQSLQIQSFISLTRRKRARGKVAPSKWFSGENTSQGWGRSLLTLQSRTVHITVSTIFLKHISFDPEKRQGIVPTKTKTKPHKINASTRLAPRNLRLPSLSVFYSLETSKAFAMILSLEFWNKKPSKGKTKRAWE